MIAKVLELYEHVLAVLLDAGAHELVEQLVVLGAEGARLVQSDVVGIVAQLLVVRAHVDGDGQALVGLYAREGRVKGELAHGDAHAAGAEVAEPEDALAVRHADRPYRLLWPVTTYHLSWYTAAFRISLKCAARS